MPRMLSEIEAELAPARPADGYELSKFSNPSRWGCIAPRSGCVAAGMAVDLQASDAQPRHAVGLNRALPGHELFDRQLVAAANFFETDGPAAHRVNDHCLAPRDPTFCLRRRQVERPGVDLPQNLLF